jgi:hypothetical protein
MSAALIELTADEAAQLVSLILGRLERMGADDVREGIAESQRLGVEQLVDASLSANEGWSRADLNKVGTFRRRPLTDAELLRLVLDRLHQRLLVIQAAARSTRERLEAGDVVWLVDREFVPEDQTDTLEARSADLTPEDSAAIRAAVREIRRLVPEYVPEGGDDG